MNDHIKICDGTSIKHVFKGGVYEPKANIKQRLCWKVLASPLAIMIFYIPHLAVYDMEVPFPVVTVQPAAKWAKMCTDVHGNQVKRKLKLNSRHQLLSYSMTTNIPGFEGEEIFKCKGDTDEDIKNFVPFNHGTFVAIE